MRVYPSGTRFALLEHPGDGMISLTSFAENIFDSFLITLNLLAIGSIIYKVTGEFWFILAGCYGVITWCSTYFIKNNCLKPARQLGLKVVCNRYCYLSLGTFISSGICFILSLFGVYRTISRASNRG
ncbi:hypothetical protein DFJ63DRAFT_319486 [Scheffersomyces coipomensis]|uniref:uncharacterized protein n=1 Tax=Scheffersomyces coipomensis TaxID=1788519 RepID=UPI00315D539F